jgi:hypothetical protein
MNQDDRKDMNIVDTKLADRNRQEINDFDPTAYFKKDKNFLYAHQKVKKLVAAVYMITGYFDAAEPMRWSLRSLGNDLLRLNIAFKDSGAYGTSGTESAMREKVLELISLLEVASFAGLVSPMNLSVLKREFGDLMAHIAKAIKAGERSALTVDKAFFDVAPAAPEAIPFAAAEEPEPFKDMGLSARIAPAPAAVPSVRNVVQSDVPRIVREVAAPTHKQEEHASQGQDERVSSDPALDIRAWSPVVIKKNKRQATIIALMKRRKEVMIKDISSVIHDCSEKTIQRELQELVDRGVLVKEGERRWTRYRLSNEAMIR